MKVLAAAMPHRARNSANNGCDAALGTAFEGSPEACMYRKASRKSSIEMPAQSPGFAPDANASNLPHGFSRDQSAKSCCAFG
eukprot:9799843-Alexandrium_andersonii.AAC.1